LIAIEFKTSQVIALGKHCWDGAIKMVVLQIQIYEIITQVSQTWRNHVTQVIIRQIKLPREIEIANQGKDLSSQIILGD
jgi:hypothetical protein